MCCARRAEYSGWLMTGLLEREIKLRFDTGASARAAVLALNARPLRPRRLQSDALLDRDDASLGKSQRALRVRIEDGHSFVTFKGPPQQSTMKVREEIETPVGDGALALTIFERLGYTVWFRYEKYREEFALDGVTVAIDETPIGTFVELEGSAEGIASIAAALGRGPADYVVASYRSLFVEHCAERGIQRSHMLFDRR